ncbi:MAG: hypothetical protein ACI9VS_000086 [Candidatus Binatia bacterium]|jgi:hypothetical protein
MKIKKFAELAVPRITVGHVAAVARWWSRASHALASAATCVLFCAFTASAAKPQLDGTSRSPNIIVILADDIGAAELSCYGHPEHKTPVLDRLGDEGVKFETCFTAPVCHPTRFMLMTGQYGCPPATALINDSANDLFLSEASVLEIETQNRSGPSTSTSSTQVVRPRPPSISSRRLPRTASATGRVTIVSTRTPEVGPFSGSDRPTPRQACAL